MQPGEGANPTQGHTALDSNPTSATTSGGRGPEPATGLPQEESSSFPYGSQNS